MKIAGLKNDGAWYRNNKMIKRLTAGQKDAYESLMVEETNESGPTAFTTLTDFAGQSGLAGEPGIPETLEQWIHQLTHVGIPRQVWMGKLSWDTYTLDGDVYKPDNETAFQEFGEDVRRASKKFRLYLRQVQDLSNARHSDYGNPGGVADAIKEGENVEEP